MPALVTIPAVPVAQVGTWQTATGEWVCTPEQLRSAVAAEASGSFRTPILKIGHDDARFTDGAVLGDGEPAVGRLERLRLTDDGTTLLADLVGVPAWLGEILASAYPSRSIEAALDVPAGDTVWPMVVTGLALLGVQAPAIESLGDIADLYGVSRQVEDYVAAARAYVAASALPREDPVPRALGQVVASASIDELATAAEKWAKEQPLLGEDAWPRDVFTDAVIFTAWRGDECRYYRVPWTEGADGTFTFGTPEQVRPTYEPIPQGGQAPAVAASGVDAMARHVRQHAAHNESSAVPSRWGRAVTAGEQPKEQHVPISPALAAELGVPEDADDTTVLEAVKKLRAPEQPATPATDSNQEGGTTNTAPAPADVESLVAARVDAAIQAAVAPVIARLGEASDELARIKANEAEKTKDSVLSAAITAGKIKPADREQWAKDYDEAPSVVTAMLARLAPGTAVPVTAAGHVGGDDHGTEPFSEAEYRAVFGEGANV